MGQIESLETALRSLGIDPKHAADGLHAKQPFVVAMNLAAMGFRGVASNKRKKGLGLGWPEEATTDPVKLFWRQHQYQPPCWSILTGRENGVIALDIDGAIARDDLARLQVKLGPLPEKTVRVRSGRIDGGDHIWLKPPAGTDDLKNQQPIPGTKIDLRGWHGHIVVPGSLHWSGAVYSWAPGCAPDECEIAE